MSENQTLSLIGNMKLDFTIVIVYVSDEDNRVKYYVPLRGRYTPHF